MRKIWCKLWNFILGVFVSVVEGVAFALETLGTVAVELLASVADAVGEALGIDGSTVLWLGLGVVAFFLLRGSKSEEEVRSYGQTSAGNLRSA